jgi:hypothetical protein
MACQSAKAENNNDENIVRSPPQKTKEEGEGESDGTIALSSSFPLLLCKQYSFRVW